MYDCLIEGAKVVDGSGNPWVRADVAVSDGTIAAVGRLCTAQAAKRVNARDMVLAPGFIDGHSHTEPFALSSPSSLLAKVSQGVTTDIVGVCGASVFPLTAQSEGLPPWNLPVMHQVFEGVTSKIDGPWFWHSYADLVAILRCRNLPISIGSMVGHGAIRSAVVGTAHRSPNPDELVEMQRLVDLSLAQGALGLSFGLAYPPGNCANKAELVALARIAAQHGRPCSVHMRDEGERLLASVDEMLWVARESGCRLVISHLKAAGRENWGKVEQALDRIQIARSQGLDIFVDAYPYTAGSPSIVALLPPWVSDGGLEPMLTRLRDCCQRRRIAAEIEAPGPWENLCRLAGWENVFLLGFSPDPRLEGKSLAALSERLDAEPASVLMDLILDSKGTASVMVSDMDPDDVRTVIEHRLSMVISDGGCSSGITHPRLYGAFSRFLSRYAGTEGAVPLEEAVRKITSLPAMVYGLTDRGLIIPGLRADLVLFAPDAVLDNATYREPDRLSGGIQTVLVGGQTVYQAGQLTGAWPGKVVVL